MKRRQRAVGLGKKTVGPNGFVAGLELSGIIEWRYIFISACRAEFLLLDWS
jgi:hypothetical protein